jgi:hypothetical protein
MENEAVGCRVATVLAIIVRHRITRVQELFSRWRLEDSQMRYGFLDKLDLAECFARSQEDLTVRLLYKELLTIDRVTRRGK